MKIGVQGEFLQEARTLPLILATACCQVRWTDATEGVGGVDVEVKAVGITQIEI